MNRRAVMLTVSKNYMLSLFPQKCFISNKVKNIKIQFGTV